MKTLLAILALSLFALPASAAPRLCKLGKLLDAIVLTDTLANRTATIGPEELCGNLPGGKTTTVGSFQWLNLDIDYTRATAGDLTITITTGITVADADAEIGFCSTVVNGDCASVGGGLITITVGATSIHRDHKINIRTRRVLKIVVAHSAAAAGDILTLNGYLTD